MKSLVCFVFSFLLELVYAEIGDLEATFLDSWVHHNQRSSLQVFLEETSTLSEKSILSHTWFQNDEYLFDYCDFSGIGCDSVGYVVSLNVSNAMLAGTLPGEIGKLSRLRTFRANDNELKGSIPSTISQLTDLHYLNLGHNLLEGNLPDFSTLLSLRRLFLDRNAFSGTVPSSLCHVKQLDTLDLSRITKMWGTLPDCLGNLAKLTRLRITDIALTGEIPQGLCARQQYGCDGIGCPSRTFRPGSGRQTSPDLPCLPCDVPSNVIASTTCRWQEKYSDPPTVFPTSVLDGAATLAPSATPSFQNSIVSSFSPSLVAIGTDLELSDSPSTAPSHMLSSPPSEVPSIRRSAFPTSILPEYVISSAPSVGLSSQPTGLPTSTPAPPPVSAIMQDPVVNKDAGKKGLMPAALAVCGVIMCAGICAWKRKEALKQDRYLHVDKPGSKPLSRETGDEYDKDPNSPEPLEFLETPETVDASEVSDPPAAAPYTTRIPSILKRRSSLSSSTVSQFVRSPSGRKVRFSLPQRFSWSSVEAGGSEDDDKSESHSELGSIPNSNSEHGSNSERESNSESESPTNDFDAWVSWIMNPLMEVGNALSSVAEADESDVYASSSYESSTNNSEAPLLPTDESSSAFWDDSSAQEETQSVGSHLDSSIPRNDTNEESLLGIRERKPADNDTQVLLEAGKLFHQASRTTANVSNEAAQNTNPTTTDSWRTKMESENPDMKSEEGVELMEI